MDMIGSTSLPCSPMRFARGDACSVIVPDGGDSGPFCRKDKKTVQLVPQGLDFPLDVQEGLPLPGLAGFHLFSLLDHFSPQPGVTGFHRRRCTTSSAVAAL